MMPKAHFDRALLEARGELCGLVGVDEVGRGCLAGPVVAGAVWISRRFYEQGQYPEFVAGVKDSKQLNHKTREQVWAAYLDYNKQAHEVKFAWGMATVREIEQHNILGATMIAMQRALQRLRKGIPGLELENPCDAQLDLLASANSLFASETIRCGLLVDGRPLKRFPWRHHAVPKADDKSLAVGLASIGAKLVRDYHLIRLCKRWPGYGLSVHKGYATPTHCEAIRSIGLTPIHRTGFCQGILSRE